MIKIIIDNREQQLQKLFVNSQFSILYENLEEGDIQIHINDKPFMIIERKTLNDLTASIKDGRYKKQKLNLLEKYNSQQIYYIIEGTIDYSIVNVNLNGISKNIILSCILNTCIRDNIKILMTKDITDTYNCLINIFERISKEPEKYTTAVINTEIIPQKCKIVDKTKCFENQLCQVPNISIKTARAIIMKYNSFVELYTNLKDLSEEDKKSKLSDIYTDDGNGKKRRISEKVVKNLIYYLL